MVAVHGRERSDVRRREPGERMLQVARVGELHEVAEQEDELDPFLGEPRERLVDAPVEVLGLEDVDPARARRLELAVEIAEDADPHAQPPTAARRRRSSSVTAAAPANGSRAHPGAPKAAPSTTAIPASTSCCEESSPRSSQRNGVAGGSAALQDRVVADGGVGSVPVAAVALGNLVQPGLWPVERGSRGPLGDVADANHVPLQLAEAPLDHRGLGGDEADPPGGHGEALAEAADRGSRSARPRRSPARRRGCSARTPRR